MDYFKSSINSQEIDEVVDTIKSGWLTSGPKTKQFEDDFRDYIGCEHATAVNSCTSALFLSLVCHNIQPNDEVITTPFTFTSTANIIIHLGAKPVFVDIRKDTYNIDENLIEDAITDKTRAIIPVHYAGHPCEMDKIQDIADANGLVVIEDAAHAVASKYKGKRIGTIGNTTCFSFYVTKNMTTGEGGMITTNSDFRNTIFRNIRLHGITKDIWNRKDDWRYDVIYPGYKCNMLDIQASIGIHQLRKLNYMQQRREYIVERYNKAFKHLNITLPISLKHIKHSWYIYPIQVDNRDNFISKLKSKGIDTSVHFIPIHLHSYYKDRYGYKRGDFPVAESVYDRIVSLPLYPDMSDDDIDKVIKVVGDVL